MPQETSQPDSDDIARIDHLARAAQGLDPAIAPDALWSAVLRLEQWWVIALPEGEQLNPSIGPIEGARALLAFTTPERGQTFADSVIVPRPDSDTPRPVAVHPAYLVEHAPIYGAVGADILLFNPNDVGFFCSLAHLPALWKRTHGASASQMYDEIPSPNFD